MAVRLTQFSSRAIFEQIFHDGSVATRWRCDRIINDHFTIRLQIQCEICGKQL